MRKGEWLDDLVWFHQQFAAAGLYEAIRHQVAVDIERRATEIYRGSRTIQIEDLWAAWQMRSEDPLDDWPGSSDRRPPFLGGRLWAWQARETRLAQMDRPKVKDLWWNYHTNYATRKEWDRTIKVDLDEGGLRLWPLSKRAC